MSDITPNGAVLELAKLSRTLDEAGYRLHDAERKAVKSRHEFTVAQAKAFLTAEGSIQARTAQGRDRGGACGRRNGRGGGADPALRYPHFGKPD
jgi:hypothetical protein